MSLQQGADQYAHSRNYLRPEKEPLKGFNTKINRSKKNNKLGHKLVIEKIKPKANSLK